MSHNKSILYIGSPMVNYHKHIKDEFEKQGYQVDFFSDRPSENPFIKGLIKIRKSSVNTVIERYFNNIIDEIQNKKYDLVFIMNGKVYTPDMLKRLKNNQKEARFVLYLWDSLALYPHVKELLPHFDSVFSFDSDDCDKNSLLKFLPLFYCKPYEEINKTKIGIVEYDIVSICTTHPNRYRIIHELFPKLEANGVKIFSYMYLHRLQYLYNKFFVNEFKRAKNNEFKFKPLSEEENVNMIRKSNAVFDIQHSKQSGLTMRTIETLGAGKKLITTNEKIKNYDFYNENNIYILDEHNQNGIKVFLCNQYEPLPDEIYKKYSLSSWIQNIIKS